MRKKNLGYFVLGLVLLVGAALSVNNYYQTQHAKRAELARAAANNSSGLNGSSPQYQNQAASRMLAVVNISGFDCPSCPAIAQSAIKNSSGVLDAKVTQSGEASKIIYNPAVTSIDNIKKALPDTYKLQLVQQTPTTVTAIN